MLGMVLEMRCTMQPHTSSVFPHTERLLGSEGDYQKSLEFVASRKKMERYQDVIDFLFCELVIGMRRHCMRYYNGEGPPLRELSIATSERLLLWDAFLMGALEVARAALEQKRRLSWSQYKEFVLAASGI
ncbi:hypothetical protein HY479_00995 [Candidatus Uhrbacteria bacterium]|nr:hypothetical protein [Candidatus Uhrbacteria bacterium]